MKIEVGKSYVNGFGTIYRVTENKDYTYPFKVYVMYNGQLSTENNYTITENGHVYNSVSMYSANERKLDLIKEIIKENNPEYWL